MSANPLFSQRFQGCLYCLIFDFQGSWPAHSRDSHMISASPRTVNKNFALFLFFCPSAEYTIFAVFWGVPRYCRFIDILYPVAIPILSFAVFRNSAPLWQLPVFSATPSSHSHSNASHTPIVSHSLSACLPYQPSNLYRFSASYFLLSPGASDPPRSHI